MSKAIIWLAALLALAGPAMAAPQESDAYTRYELLAPETGRFRILYDVTAARPGATAYYNPIRKGSVASDERVLDRASGAPLPFAVVSGAQAKADGLENADAAMDYIKVDLARPVPADGGGGRIRIEKTYEDAKSYHADGADIVFVRGLGIKNNAVVLPPGYALIACNYPSQIEREADGRIKISFFNVTPAEAPLSLRARAAGPQPGGTSLAGKFTERAAQTRDIVYFLREPDSHAFDLYHDYTEQRPGVGVYVNVVRKGSTASHPSARNLDSGEAIPAEHLHGIAAITAAGLDAKETGPLSEDSEVVLFRFARLQPGQTVRLRMAETYTDPASYRLAGDELIFERSFGRARNAVVLPAGWLPTNSASPAIVSETDDGRIRLDFLNPRGDELAVLVTARRKS